MRQFSRSAPGLPNAPRTTHRKAYEPAHFRLSHRRARGALTLLVAFPPTLPAQCERAMDNVEALLAAARMTTAHIVKPNYYATQATDFPTLVQIRQRRWAFDPAPSVTAIAVSALARPEYLIEIEAVAIALTEPSP